MSETVIVSLVAFILNICGIIESMYGAVIWFNSTNKSAGKVWVVHGFFLICLASALLLARP